MADRENALGKKTIIAIIAVIVLLFIAGISVGIFLADKGSSEAVDGNQVADVNKILMQTILIQKIKKMMTTTLIVKINKMKISKQKTIIIKLEKILLQIIQI